jgi:phosphotransferase system  glucose/maltose/N-acetylglucosamine-specific IIC component
MVKIKKEDAIRMGGGVGKDVLCLLFVLNMFFTGFFIGYLVYEIFNWKGEESVVLCVGLFAFMVWSFSKIWPFYFKAIKKRKEVTQRIEDNFTLSNCKVEAGLEMGVHVEIV